MDDVIGNLLFLPGELLDIDLLELEFPGNGRGGGGGGGR